MAIDYKKAEKALYLPGPEPARILVPPMPFIAVDGAGDPNEAGGAYGRALDVLYTLCYTIKMSKLGGGAPAGYFDYVVPPLEGLWCMENGAPGVDYGNKAGFTWMSMIRQPSFVTPAVFEAAQQTALKKKGVDTSIARLTVYDEGDAVQCMHFGAFDDEPATMARMEAFLAENGLVSDYGARRHHEIYLGDPRKVAVEKRRTVLRIPVREA